MDDIKRPQPKRAHTERSFDAAANRPTPVWNSVTRQWWVPPAPAKTAATPAKPAPQQVQSIAQASPTTAPLLVQATPKTPRKNQITVNVKLPYHLSRAAILHAIKHGPKQPKNRIGRRLHNSMRISRWPRYSFSGLSFLVVFVLLAEIVLPWLDVSWQSTAYALSNNDKAVLEKIDTDAANALKYNAESGAYIFAPELPATLDSGNSITNSAPKMSASFSRDSAKGVTVTDKLNESSLTITPKFRTLEGRQQGNQVLYPINGNMALVYTAQAAGVKEDILVRKPMGDTISLTYDLGLGNKYEAKVQEDGSLNIYGIGLSPLNVATTSNKKDAELLRNAQAKAKKDKLLFTLPAPTIREAGVTQKSRASYSVKNGELTVTAVNLEQATYPISIDPTVQVATINEFYRNTNIESNVDFDVSTGTPKITRGSLTGGITSNWAATTTMNQSRFLFGATAYNGYVYVLGGSSSSLSTANIAGNATNMVEFAPISTTTPAVNNSGDSVNPSTLGAFESGNNQGLPAGGLSRFQLIGYNGYLYAIGGSLTDTTCASPSAVVYAAAVQVNGILSNWTQLSGSGNMGTARCSFGATAYNGAIYVAGGKTGSAASSATADVSYANVLPDGNLMWTNAVVTALPLARYGHDLQAYNGYLYTVGGQTVSAGTPSLTNSVQYIALNSNRSIYGTGTSDWKTTNAFDIARENLGTVFTAIKNGYMYLSGGCSALDAGQSCTTALADTQLVQLNADGSLGQWATTNPLAAARVGGAEVAWRGTIYNLGGCAAMNASTISCSATLASIQYATITSAGQASKLKSSNDSPAPASALPAALFGASAVVNNGFIYVVGGCIQNDCQQVNPGNTASTTYYAAINSNGTLGAWTTAAQTINAPNGIAATTLVAANGVLYAMGGWTRGTAGNNSIYTVTPNADGSLPANWALNGTNLRSAQYAMSALYYNGFIYTFGGCVATTTTFGCNTFASSATAGTGGNVVRYSVNGTSIGANSVTSLTQIPNATLNVPNASMGLAFYNGYIYLCGGSNSNGTANGGPQTQKCIYNKLNSNGTITTAWSISTGSLNVGASPESPIRRAAAYASNGYLYVYSGHDGVNNSPVGTINIGKLNPTTGDIDSNFAIATTAFTAKWDTASVFANGNIYTMGGCITGDPPASCTARSSLTEYFQIYNATNSSSRDASVTTALTIAYVGVAAVVHNGYLYLAGGCGTYTVATTNCGSTTSDTQYAAINPDGSLPATFTVGPTMPQSRGFGCLVVNNGSLYYLGGANNGPPQASVFYSTIGANGVPAAFASATTLPGNAYGGTCATYNNRIYITGGQTANNANSVTATSYFSSAFTGPATITWTALANSFTTARNHHSTVAVAGYLYIMGGGTNDSNYLSDVQFAQINNTTGNVGPWSYSTDLPYKMRQAGAFAANGYIHLLGGVRGNPNVCMDTTFVTNVSSTGTLGFWQKGVASSFSARTGAGAAFYNGYYYVIGGNDCTTNLTSNFIAGEQSQAIRSFFTRYIDLVGDATPRKFIARGSHAVVNALNIEYWRMRYQSSRIGTATAGFGSVTSVANMPFGGSPFTITALNTSGVDEGVSRYWSMSFDIDQTQSFAFTDTPQPEISSYDFYYSPSGNTRLRNGRQFQDQTKQGLDVRP